MNKIEVRYDHRRGCGWRKPGGLYLIGGNMAAPCGKLPIPLTVCPTFGHGIKPSRGWTWINGKLLAADLPCTQASYCDKCPLHDPPEQVGLLWIGEKFYRSTGDFNREASMIGISRRIAALPNDFKLGEIWVWLAHRRGKTELHTICNGQGCADCQGEGWLYTPAVFQVFLPSAIEYVVTGEEDDEDLARLVKRGITPVKIERAGEQKELIATGDEKNLCNAKPAETTPIGAGPCNA